MNQDIKYTIIEICNEMFRERDNEMNIKHQCVSEESIYKPIIELGVDSMALVQLVVLIEEKYEIEIPDEYLLFDENLTLESLIKIVSDLVQG